ncbi:hypothetical protein CH380_20130 [Leptospira adleri]|uniref:Uncharacterized protein n=1 Tax=Leptospira adleri TaxID=2023186 RepID=A0A2M9YIX7_9LEPT|nr:hypothetical protein CH380_20130 [Leptospira adleri]PJZ61705.1 hypothetical protein CH376_12010 [Leptospira adleri]
MYRTKIAFSIRASFRFERIQVYGLEIFVGKDKSEKLRSCRERICKIDFAPNREIRYNWILK